MRNTMNLREKKFSIKINLAMNVWKIWYLRMCDCNLYVKEKEGKMQSNDLEP